MAVPRNCRCLVKRAPRGVSVNSIFATFNQRLFRAFEPMLYYALVFFVIAIIAAILAQPSPNARRVQEIFNAG